MLRLINGGVDASPILTPDRMRTLVHVEASQYREYAAMRGDSSDNLAGLPGVGETTAAKLLSVFPTMADAFADVAAGGDRVRAACGPAMVKKLADPAHRAAYDETVEIMTMYTDIDLGLDLTAPGAGLLPLPAATGSPSSTGTSLPPAPREAATTPKPTGPTWPSATRGPSWCRPPVTRRTTPLRTPRCSC